MNFKVDQVRFNGLKTLIQNVLNPFQWVYAIRLEIDFKAGVSNNR
jgi:hypothetical protein